jgi:TonB family protein
VLDGNARQVVRSADDSTPYIVKDGKSVPVNGRMFELRGIAEYFPVVVNVTDFGVNVMSTRGFAISGAHAFCTFSGTYEATQDLQNVFVAIAVDSEWGKKLFLRGIGNLSAYHPVKLLVDVPMEYGVSKGRFNIHVFTDGAEVLNSSLGSLYVAEQLARMAESRTSGLQDQKLRPFVYFHPRFPQNMSAGKKEGSAVVRVHVTQTGDIGDLSIERASDPAFGKTAMECVQGWWFLPTV